MRAVIVYESMFGNTHTVAEQIGAGLEEAFEVSVLAVGEADEAALASTDLVVVGGPTHVHGLTSKTSRKNAVEVAAEDDDLDLDPDAEGPGLRDWFHSLEKRSGVAAAAFDTRIDASPVLTGRASKGIARRLSGHGFDVVTEPMSFLVDKESHLEDGEAERAREWGRGLIALVPAGKGATSTT